MGDRVTECDRVGIRTDVAKKIQLDLIQADYDRKELQESKRLIELKDLRIQVADQQAELWKKDAYREREAYDKERSRSKTAFWIGMGVGFLTVLAGAYSIKQVGR